MEPAADREVRAPSEALDLHESIVLGDRLELTEALSSRWQPEPGSAFDSKGRVPIYIIRPGIGKGRGRHLYEAKMLEDHAHVFRGWKMYVDHQSPEAKKAAGGLPRSLRDAGGIVKESFWDPDVPADPANGWDQGAVVGLVKPTSLVKGYIEDDPEIVEASIHAQATGVKPTVRDGQKCWLVEGIRDRGSVDWVSEAGAGGRVIALMEAAYSDGLGRDDIAAMSDDEFREWVATERPNLKLAEAGVNDDDPEEGGADDMPITREALQEAIAASPTLLVEALQQSAEAQDFVRALVEATLEEEREVIRAEARADVQREIQLRDMRDEAHRVIRESRLPESWQTGLRDRFDLVEGVPTSALDVVDEVDDSGNVTKSAIDLLRESLEQQIETERDRLREVSPTRVRGLGAAASTGGEKSDVKPSETGWGRFLRESAHIDPDTAFSLRGAGENA